MPMLPPIKCYRKAGLLAALLFLNSCYTYKLNTKAQPATDELTTTTLNTYSLFWGLMNQPQVLHTPNCDTLGALGVSEVKVQTNLGYALITVATLGIYCPIRVVYKCSKPCPQEGEL